MTGFLERALTGRVGSFFLVFPDCDAVTPLAQIVRAIAANHYAHPSGRPWLVGRWADDECVVVGDRDSRLAMIGTFPPGHFPPGVGLSVGGDVDRLTGELAESLPGSFHLITSSGGEVTVSGTASGTRLVFSATIGAVTLAASRADVLAELTGAGLDETQVAVRLLSFVPHPLALDSVWRGVQAVEPGSRLRLGRDGSARTRVWWTPPVPAEPLSVGVPKIRAALSEAVSARTEAGGTVTCDLSGGLDAAAICFLAAAGPAKVIARTIATEDTNPATHLPEVEHVIMPGVDWPPLDFSRHTEMGDEPALLLLGRAELERFYFPLASLGGRLHLTGFGYESSARAGRRSFVSLRRLPGYPAWHAWRYQKWLLKSAYQLRTSPQLRLPEWVTPAATTAVRKAIIRAAATAEPIAPGHESHVELSAIREGGRRLRQFEQVCAAAGLPTASPFFDDIVLRACLSIRAAQRPVVLSAALRGIVPDDFKVVKDVAPPAADPLEIWDGSVLAAMGIVNEKRLRAAATARNTAVSVELWLRAVTPGSGG